MHFYQKNIGDFNNATRHLTRVERSLFSDAIELYYDTEKPLTSDINKLNRLLLAHSQDEKDALLLVLSEFFTLTDDGYFNKRCNEEIIKYHTYIESKSKAGKASADKREEQKSTRVQHAFNTSSTKYNQEPLTINQEPLKEKPCAAFALPDWIDKSQWDLWLKTRKGKKMIPEQMQAQVNKLDRWRGAGLDYAKALSDAALNGWMGLQEPFAKPSKQSRHVGFDKIDYREGVNADGTF